MCYFCCHSNVVESGNSIVDQKVLLDAGVEYPEVHVMDVWVLFGVDRVGVGQGCRVSP